MLVAKDPVTHDARTQLGQQYRAVGKRLPSSSSEKRLYHGNSGVDNTKIGWLACYTRSSWPSVKSAPARPCQTNTRRTVPNIRVGFLVTIIKFDCTASSQFSAGWLAVGLAERGGRAGRASSRTATGRRCKSSHMYGCAFEVQRSEVLDVWMPSWRDGWIAGRVRLACWCRHILAGTSKLQQ